MDAADRGHVGPCRAERYAAQDNRHPAQAEQTRKLFYIKHFYITDRFTARQD